MLIVEVVGGRVMGEAAVVGAFARDPPDVPKESIPRHKRGEDAVRQRTHGARRCLCDHGVEHCVFREHEHGGGVDTGGAGVSERVCRGRARGGQTHKFLDAVCGFDVHFKRSGLRAPAGGHARALCAGVT